MLHHEWKISGAAIRRVVVVVVGSRAVLTVVNGSLEVLDDAVELTRHGRDGCAHGPGGVDEECHIDLLDLAHKRELNLDHFTKCEQRDIQVARNVCWI